MSFVFPFFPFEFLASKKKDSLFLLPLYCFAFSRWSIAERSLRPRDDEEGRRLPPSEEEEGPPAPAAPLPPSSAVVVVVVEKPPLLLATSPSPPNPPPPPSSSPSSAPSTAMGLAGDAAAAAAAAGLPGSKNGLRGTGVEGASAAAGAKSGVAAASAVLYFKAKDDTLSTRLLKRGMTSGRSDDNLESIQKRLATFHQQSYPVILYFQAKDKVLELDAEKKKEEIFEALKAGLKSKDV